MVREEDRMLAIQMQMGARGLLLKTGVGVGLLAFLLPLTLGGCRTQQIVACGTEVATCDTIQGRLPPGRCSQSFTLEGVESSLLDFDLKSDQGNLPAPRIQLVDPQGKQVALAAQTNTAKGAATTHVRDVVLLRSGTYQVTVTPQGCEEVFYAFNYRLHFPGIRDLRVNLTSCDTYPIRVSAPRGGQVTVQITPWQGSCTKVQVKGVEDPWGGRALESCRRLPNAPPPQVSHGDDGSYYLNFNAPIPGRYTVLAAAKPGGEGPAVVSVVVKQPRTQKRTVIHPNRAAQGYGVPAACGSMSDR